MKVVFICSSLEPGRDGVGDYTRLLAGEIIKQGNLAAIVSVNDKYVDAVTIGRQEVNGIKVSVMRIPSGLAYNKWLVDARAWVDGLNPEWLSLQFVPFGFHPKGLPFNLSKQLLFLSGDRKWHIMFHELWVGIAREESKKLHYWGLLQRAIIRSLLLKVKPSVIHTQTLLYQKLLDKLGFKAQLLPLFGNIPVVESQLDKTTNEISLVVFGLIHSGAPIHSFAREAAEYSRNNNVNIKLTFIGRCGAEQERWAEIWRSESLELDIMAEQSAEKISAILSNSSMGISATALAVIEKSGTFAAMHDHKLAVISVSKPWNPIGITGLKTQDGIVEYSIGNFESCIKADLKSNPLSLTKIVADLTNSLSKTTTRG